MTGKDRGTVVLHSEMALNPRIASWSVQEVQLKVFRDSPFDGVFGSNGA